MHVCVVCAVVVAWKEINRNEASENSASPLLLFALTVFPRGTLSLASLTFYLEVVVLN